MILKCDFCGETLTILEAEIFCLTAGDPCPECEEFNNDGVLQCSYEDETD